MNNKSIVGALLILASAVLFSASLICSSLSAVATATSVSYTHLTLPTKLEV